MTEPTLAYSDRWLSIYGGDCRDVMRSLPEASIDCIVTSPPYYGLRDYGLAVWVGGDEGCSHMRNFTPRSERPNPGGSRMGDGGDYNDVQDIGRSVYRDVCGRCGAVRVEPTVWADGWRGALGLEPTPQMYVAHLVEVFREIRRILKPTGVAWLNLGDTYAANWSSRRDEGGAGTKDTARERVTQPPPGLKSKDLMLIPARVAIALVDDGWYLRSDVIWHKPNPMPESVTDRPTKSHEHIFMLAQNERYFYDSHGWREPVAESSVQRVGQNDGRPILNTDRQRGYPGGAQTLDITRMVDAEAGRNMRDVWSINTVPYPGAHFAVFPPSLVERPIRVSTSEHGCCSHCGAPWARVLARAWKGERNTRAGDDGQQVHREGVSHDLYAIPATTTDWRPTCTCNAPPGVLPGDLEVILSPLGEGTEDPTMEVGRAGMARERDPEGGQRPMTRYEQRKYAEQLRAWSVERVLEGKQDVAAHLTFDADAVDTDADATTAWEHYTRTDRIGARPLPERLRARWVQRGWLTEPVLPEWEPPAVEPAVVLDPFGGSGTVGMMAQRLGRRAILIDLNPAYLEQQLERAAREFGVGGPRLRDEGWTKPPPTDVPLRGRHGEVIGHKDSLWTLTDEASA